MALRPITCRLMLRLGAAVLATVALAACGTTESTTFSSIGEELPAPSATTEPTPIPTPSTAICDAFNVVNDVISPAFTSLAEGVADTEQLASTIEAAAASIEDLAEEEPNPEVAEQIAEMAERYANEANSVRRGDLGSLEATDYYLDLVVEHADRGTCP